MENRKAFDLKGILIVYNFGVVALSLYMIYEVGFFFFFALVSVKLELARAIHSLKYDCLGSSVCVCV